MSPCPCYSVCLIVTSADGMSPSHGTSCVPLAGQVDYETVRKVKHASMTSLMVCMFQFKSWGVFYASDLEYLTGKFAIVCPIDTVDLTPCTCYESAAISAWLLSSPTSLNQTQVDAYTHTCVEARATHTTSLVQSTKTYGSSSKAVAKPTCGEVSFLQQLQYFTSSNMCMHEGAQQGTSIKGEKLIPNSPYYGP